MSGFLLLSMFIRRAAFLAPGTIFEHYTGYGACPDTGVPVVGTLFVFGLGPQHEL